MYDITHDASDALIDASMKSHKPSASHKKAGVGQNLHV